MRDAARRVLFVMTIALVVMTAVMLGPEALTGNVMAWVQIILAVSLAGGMLHASVEARRAGDRQAADVLLRWATTATAILAISNIRAEDQRLQDCAKCPTTTQR